MKQGFLLPILLLQHLVSLGQFNNLVSSAFEQQMELQADEDDPGDAYQDILSYYSRHPLNLNLAGEDELKELMLLNALQVKNFLVYRSLFGNLVHLYELQSVPLWDLNTIRLLLPYVKVSEANGILEGVHERSKGKHSIMARTSLRLEKAKGFQSNAPDSNRYLGSQNRLTIGYRYQLNNRLQWGMIADKDAGEQLFKGKQKTGFDFYSLHFFVRKKGMIKTIAIGDYSVNLGQGLIHWQSMAFKKNPDITTVKRQSPVLRPYTSAGEFNFHRGIAITAEKKHWELTCFFSNRKHSSNAGADSMTRGDYFSSLITNGYHRTLNELASKNNLRQITMGGSLKYSAGQFTASINMVRYRFSKPVEKRDQPYNLYAIRGNSLFNHSVDYSYTYKNAHFFGEAAMDHNGSKGFLHGLMVAPDKLVNASLVHRFIDRNYQALYANAFTENTSPTNENGLYAGIAVRPTTAWNIEAYMDIFRFPWLKYRVDAPSSGKEYFVQVHFTPNKQTEIYTRFKTEVKPVNLPNDNNNTRTVYAVQRQNWRIHTNLSLNKHLQIRNRCEMIWYNRDGPSKEDGFLMFTDVLYKPPLKAFSFNTRFLYFETDGYNSRLYAFENDVMSTFSVPAIFDKGIRYYLNTKVNISDLLHRSARKTLEIECSAGFSQTVYKEKMSTGTGLDIVQGRSRSGVKLQVVISL